MFRPDTAALVLQNVQMTKKLVDLLEGVGVEISPFLAKQTTRSFRLTVGKEAVDQKMVESLFREEELSSIPPIAEYVQAWVAVSVMVCVVLPIVSLVLGFTVRCFLWAAGFRNALF